jgi:hypothetical protein
MKKNETVREILEWLGAKLLTTESNVDIEISHAMAAEIVAILSSLPAGKAGRPKQWTAATEIRAVLSLLDGTPVNVLAREIAAETGQLERSAERRLRAMKQSRRYTNWRRG